MQPNLILLTLLTTLTTALPIRHPHTRNPALSRRDEVAGSGKFWGLLASSWDSFDLINNGGCDSFEGNSIKQADVHTGFRCRFFTEDNCQGDVIGKVEGLVGTSPGWPGVYLVEGGQDDTTPWAKSCTCWRG